jgi:hypothetical protein
MTTKCWQTWAHNHDHARTIGSEIAVRCKSCGGEVWFDSTTGWRWCRTLDCKVGQVNPDGSEYLKQEFLPLSKASRESAVLVNGL